VPLLEPTCGKEVRGALAELVHVFHPTVHQTVTVGVAARLRAAVTQGLLIFEKTLALLPAEGAHLSRAVGGRCRHLKAKGTGHVA
jgi:hypothetical protein